jgi:hypothetical protein
VALSQKIRLLVITREEIEGTDNGPELVELITTKVCQLIITGSVWP